MEMSGSRSITDSSRSSRHRSQRHNFMETDETMLGYPHGSNRPGTPEQAVSGIASDYSDVGLNKTRELLQMIQRVIDLKPEVEKEVDIVEKSNMTQVAEMMRKNKELGEIIQKHQMQPPYTGIGTPTDQNVKNEEIVRHLQFYENLTSQLNSENKRLQELKEQAEQKFNESESKYIQSQTTLEELQKQYEEEKKQLGELKKAYSCVSSDLNREKRAAEERLKDIKYHADEKIEQQNQNIEQLQQAVNSKNATLRKKTEELQEVRKELDETKSRLSKMMGSKMKAGNPHIADLSDKHRPTKLADAYTELYDNEWTDAFDVLQNAPYKQDDKAIVKALMDILMDVNEFCKKEVEDQTKRLKQCLHLDKMSDQPTSDHILQQLKDVQRSNAIASIKDACERYNRHSFLSFSTIEYNARKVPDFVNKCVEICLVMALQNPPLDFKIETQSMASFCKNEYRSYTKAGEFIDYIVWPPLLLNKGGPLLAKGVAQGWSSLPVAAKHVDLIESTPSPRKTKDGRRGQDQSGSYQTTTPSSICTQSPLAPSVTYSTSSSALTHSQAVITSSTGDQTSYFSNSLDNWGPIFHNFSKEYDGQGGSVTNRPGSFPQSQVDRQRLNDIRASVNNQSDFPSSHQPQCPDQINFIPVRTVDATNHENVFKQGQGNSSDA